MDKLKQLNAISIVKGGDGLTYVVDNTTVEEIPFVCVDLVRFMGMWDRTKRTAIHGSSLVSVYDHNHGMIDFTKGNILPWNLLFKPK